MAKPTPELLHAAGPLIARELGWYLEFFYGAKVAYFQVEDYIGHGGREANALALAVLALVFAAIITLRVMMPVGESLLAFSETFVRDRFGDVLKLFAYLVLAGVFVYAKHFLRAAGLFRGEFYSLSLFALLGVMIMVSAASMLTLYLGLELLALSSYALVALNRDSASGSEAAMKYFILGSLASGILLYGISLIYGATGSIHQQKLKSNGIGIVYRKIRVVKRSGYFAFQGFILPGRGKVG